MSWVGGYKSKLSTSAQESREEKRERLLAERLERAQRRDQLQKQLKQAQESRIEADQALQNLLERDPKIFESDIAQEASKEVLDEAEALLIDTIAGDEEIEIMAEFETENGEDSEKAMDKLGSVRCEFMKEDVEFWFSEIESQLEVIEVKAQWTKKTALQRLLPAEIKQDVKGLLKLTKTQAGDDIYKRIKDELLNLYGSKPEDSYIRAKNRVMTGKPSQLGKLLTDNICV